MKIFWSYFCITLITLSFVNPLHSFAKGEAALTLFPKNPTPYTPVTITLVSYLFNVNTATIIWSVNGTEYKRGLGEKSITLKTGEAGSEIDVHVKAETAVGDRYELDLAVIPESVDIMYETPESYTPLFYEGLPLPGEGALVKFVAMPNITENGEKVPASSLAYSWYVSGEFVDKLSGVGKQSALIELDFLRSFTTVKVVVRGPYGTSAEKSIDVYPNEVLPLFYTYDDILGINRTSLISRRFETTKDFTLSLEPFFLSSKNQMKETASYDWLLDGLPVTPLGGTLLSMKPKENSYGSKKLSVTVANKKRRLQKTTTELGIIFDTRK